MKRDILLLQREPTYPENKTVYESNNKASEYINQKCIKLQNIYKYIK